MRLTNKKDTDVESGVYYLVPNRNGGANGTGPTKRLVRRPKAPLTSPPLDEDFDAVTQDWTTTFTRGGVEGEGEGDEDWTTTFTVTRAEGRDEDEDELGEVGESELLRPRQGDRNTAGLLNALRNGNGNWNDGGTSSGVGMGKSHGDGDTLNGRHDGDVDVNPGRLGETTADFDPAFDTDDTGFRRSHNRSRRSTWAPTAPVDSDFDAWTYKSQTVFTTGTAAAFTEDEGEGAGGVPLEFGVPTNAIGRIIEEDRYEDRNRGDRDIVERQRKGKETEREDGLNGHGHGQHYTGSSSTARPGPGPGPRNGMGSRDGGQHNHTNGRANGVERTHEFFSYDDIPYRNRNRNHEEDDDEDGVTHTFDYTSRSPSPTTLTLTRTTSHHRRNQLRKNGVQSRPRPTQTRRRVLESPEPVPSMPPIQSIPSIPVPSVIPSISLSSSTTRRKDRNPPPVSDPNDRYLEPGVYIHNDVLESHPFAREIERQQEGGRKPKDKNNKQRRKSDEADPVPATYHQSQTHVKTPSSSSRPQHVNTTTTDQPDEFGRLEPSSPTHRRRPSHEKAPALSPRRRGPLPAAQNYQVVNRHVVEDGPERTVEIDTWREGVASASARSDEGSRDIDEVRPTHRRGGSASHDRGHSQSPTQTRAGGGGGGGRGGSRDWTNGIGPNRTSGVGGVRRRSEVSMSVYYVNADDYAVEGVDDVDEVMGMYDWKTGREKDGQRRPKERMKERLTAARVEELRRLGMRDVLVSDGNGHRQRPRWNEGGGDDSAQGENGLSHNHDGNGIIDRAQTPWPSDSEREVEQYEGEDDSSFNSHPHRQAHTPHDRVKRKSSALIHIPRPHAENEYIGELDMLRTSTPIHGPTYSSNPPRSPARSPGRGTLSSQRTMSMQWMSTSTKVSSNTNSGERLKSKPMPIPPIPSPPLPLFVSPSSPTRSRSGSIQNGRRHSLTGSQVPGHENGNTADSNTPTAALAHVLSTCDPPLLHLSSALMQLGIMTENHLRAVGRLKGETRDRELREAALNRGVTIMEWAILMDRVGSL